MMISRKIGHVTFHHDDEFKGEVIIEKGDVRLSVSMDAMRAIVAEGVRFDLASHVAKMKPADLLRRIA
ncbi:MAG: hypothetical protein GAK28_04771 [Luteibacter sp.]|uniref:hypothetical protein n=1 Tax=Luteibacter sp. TaxID=1886636 RepID=UPI001382FBC9|nr:hypothetical protein [Luteibacter sp.]KAF1003332.1 MAG: hypothetical protein GAK28_04771 [Luteibacter sp.]